MVITIVRFMFEYYGIALDAGYKYSHRLLKKTFKELKGCSFKYADSNPELVGSGHIVYVKDGYGLVLPYICPEKSLIASRECDYTLDDDKENYTDIELEISKLQTYILGELLSKYKAKPSIYRIIKNELIMRGVYEARAYKRAKEIDVDDNMEIDDKLTRRSKTKLKKKGRWK